MTGMVFRKPIRFTSHLLILPLSIILNFFAFLFVGTTISGYTSNVDISTGARVAKAELSLHTSAQSYHAGSHQVISLSIRNSGEVSTQYTIGIESPSDNLVFQYANTSPPTFSEHDRQTPYPTTVYSDSCKPTGKLLVGESDQWVLHVTRRFDADSELITPSIKIICDAQQID